MMEKGLSDGEIDMFLSALYYRYGYDFRSYSENNKRNRIAVCLQEMDACNLTELSRRVLEDKEVFYEALNRLTITVTNLFRDPGFYRAFKQLVIPELSTAANFKIWHAGCSSGEELFSLMMFLDEANLLENALIYGTDINPDALRKARRGIVGSDVIRKGATAYLEAGGKTTITDYFRVNHGYGLFQKMQKAKLVFSVHNLATDSSFAEMQVIFCRNVLIYFNEELQNRALEMITDSLSPGGFLCLGLQETLMFSSVDRFYDTIDSKHKIYRKK